MIKLWVDLANGAIEISVFEILKGTTPYWIIRNRNLSSVILFLRSEVWFQTLFVREAVPQIDSKIKQSMFGFREV